MKFKKPQQLVKDHAYWRAVSAVSLCVAGLIMSEFLPATLITPIAKDLNISAGLAGQAISITSVTAFIVSLCIAVVTNGIDRRKLILTFAILQIGSSIIVGLAPNFYILLIGRIFLGIGIGGFWSMSISIAMRLVPAHFLPKALSILFGAVAFAQIITAPMGSYFGHLIGWRNIFLASSILGILSFIWLIYELPLWKNDHPTSIHTFIKVLKKPKMAIGMITILLLFAGKSIFYTYLRPFLEHVTHVNINQLTRIFLYFGLASFIARTISRYVLTKHLKITFLVVPMILSLFIFLITINGHKLDFITILLTTCSLVFGFISVGASHWVAKSVPEEPEVGGGLLVAFIQLAITVGSGLGGFILHISNVVNVYICSSIIFILAFIMAFITFRKK